MAVWFITGSSRGFGRALVTAALGHGHKVVATARKPEQLRELAEAYPDHVLTLPLDVTDPDQVQSAINAGAAHFGRLDVIINNAGYANVAPIETADESDVRAQFETNYWGVYNVSRAAIAPLRAQGGGTIVQFSSIGGRVGGSAGIATYQAAKFAVDGFSRVLATETASFGIRVMIVEPSGFATDWAGSSMSVAPVPAEYASTVGAMNARRATAVFDGDPERAAAILTRILDRSDLPSHLLLGATAVTMALDYSKQQIGEATKWASVGRSADLGQPYPVALPDDSEQLH
jgi:NAD(P)-dependent dehydrogenase (short-subunit alcohol dehydrogenase family)